MANVKGGIIAKTQNKAVAEAKAPAYNLRITVR